MSGVPGIASLAAIAERLEVIERAKLIDPEAFMPFNNVPTFTDRQVVRQWEAIWKVEDAIAMEARQGGDGETRLHPKDDSAGPSGHRPTPSTQTKDGPNHD